MARWLVKILKTLINTGESGIVYCMECWKYVGINFNMGCIETGVYYIGIRSTRRLTLTWDVLKHEFFSFKERKIKINFNMGCIETHTKDRT